MSQYVETPTKGFSCSGALAQYLRVKTPSSLAAAGVDEMDIGTLEEASFAAGDVRAVRLRTAQGTAKMVAAGAITAGADVYAAASGKIAATGYVYIGQALEAASANNDVIEVLRGAKSNHSPVTLASASGAITVAQSTVIITKTGSLAALTLAAPTAAQNGLVLRVLSSTAFAHTITATSLIDDGVTGGSKTTATFGAFAGASIELVAYEGKWLVQSKNVVTIS